jgi:restriction system protein
MAKRGILAELLYQNQKAARRKQQTVAAAARQSVAAQRQAQQAALRSERAHLQLARASATEQKRAEHEAHQMHIEAMEAEATAKSAELAESFEDIDSLLAVSLAAAAAVDLQEIRITAVQPPFSAPEFENPTPAPQLIVAPPEPIFVEPPPLKGLGATFGGKRRHAELVAQAKTIFDDEHQRWQAEASEIPSIQLGQIQAHQRFEEKRQEKLDGAKKQYDDECQKREEDVIRANGELDELIAGVGRNDKEALQTYVSIVLGNSSYPESFPVSYDYEYGPELKELSMKVTIPGPSTVSTIREYKYNRAKDEVLPINSTQKQCKDRYAEAVYSVALRTLHEIFLGDEGGNIQTIALSVGTEDTDSATGLMKRTALVAVAVDRESFSTYDLSKVVPLATLQHLKALVSKSPYELLGIDESRGVRNRGQ